MVCPKCGPGTIMRRLRASFKSLCDPNLGCFRYPSHADHRHAVCTFCGLREAVPVEVDDLRHVIEAVREARAAGEA